MWIFDVRSLAFLAVNDAAVHQYGYSRKQFLAMSILDIRPAEDIVSLLRAELRDGRHESNNERWRHRKKDGTMIDVEITSREMTFNGRSAEVVIIHNLVKQPAPAT